MSFYFQPEGDSPTRKSFYDAILSGCIPVLFQKGVRYPYEDTLNYTNFVVFVDLADAMDKDGNIVDLLRTIPQSTITKMQETLSYVAQYFQYGVYSDGEDAFTMLLRQVLSAFEVEKYKHLWTEINGDT